MRKSGKSTKQKPLATVKGIFKAEIYRSKFRPFEATKYLDLKALKAAKSATIEIGTVEAAGRSATVAVEIRKGVLTKVKPVSCPGCEKTGKKGKKGKKGKASPAATKKFQLEVLQRIRDLGIPPLTTPKTIASLADIIEIDFGPIYILIGDNFFDLCITVSGGTDGLECSYCLFLPPACSQTGPPE
jgi:hypothetical protein